MVSYRKNISSDINGYLLMLFTVTVWGLTWPLGRWMVSSDYGLTIPPFMIASIRYIIVILFFIPLTLYMDKKLDFNFFKTHWKEITLMAVLSVVIYQFGYLYGELFTAGGDAALVIGTAPVIILFISAVLINEVLTKIKIIGALIAFIGVSLIVGFSPNIQIPLNERLLGDGLIFIAASSYATYTVLLRRLFLKFDAETRPSSIQVIFWVSLVGLVIMFPISLLWYPEYIQLSSYLVIPDRIWFGILYLAIISTVLGYVAYTDAVKILGAGRSGIFVNLVPVIGVASSILIGEVFDPLIHLTSFIFIFIGISLVNNRGKNQKKEAVLLAGNKLDTQPSPE
jgi:drug/metabolite transporter (DMT)-like permease